MHAMLYVDKQLQVIYSGIESNNKRPEKRELPEVFKLLFTRSVSRAETGDPVSRTLSEGAGHESKKSKGVKLEGESDGFG